MTPKNVSDKLESESIIEFVLKQSGIETHGENIS